MRAAGRGLAEDAVMRRLTAAIGIDPGALEVERLRWILRSRCRAVGVAGAEAYAAFLEQNKGEIDSLIEEVVVQETRFFRDPAVFEYVRAAIGRAARETDGPLRLLSAPCGTGQEAYSIAAVARLAGVPAGRFTVDACDISVAALDEARAGEYAERALAHVPGELRGALAELRDGKWQVHRELRERVNFERRNLAEAGALAGREYHVILCRNLFIYLDPAARTALAQSLAGALAPGGRLFLGTADRVEELAGLFAPVRPASSFAYGHREAVVAKAPAAAPAREMVAVRVRRARPEAAAAAREVAEAPNAATELLLQALEHRAKGEFSKAERRCRQALYLEPDMMAALELLQSLWDRNPNVRMRRALRDRILRLARPVEAV